MKISARNILSGTVSSVVPGAVNSEVDLVLSGGEKIVAIITNASVASLGLKAGTSAFAIVKANEVIVGTDLSQAKLSARNVLAGTVEKVEDGAVNSEVTIALTGGAKIVASITKHSVENLGLAAGKPVSAIVKSSNVLIGV
jgi:molybdate transport system regulatory protein